MSVAVTERAAAALKGLLDQQNPDPDQVLRLTYDADNSVKLVLGNEADGDQIVQHQGDVVMVIEPSISEDLSGTTLDCTETAAGVSLTLRR